VGKTLGIDLNIDAATCPADSIVHATMTVRMEKK
jgi:hypothetical protein